MATKTIRYVSEGRQDEYDEAEPTLHAEAHAEENFEAAEPRCATCGELLAWHESACQAAAPPDADEPAPPPRMSAQDFAYRLGHLVQPTPGAPARPVIWRGQLKERHPATGLVYRVNVYRLDDGYWDCYREEELQVA